MKIFDGRGQYFIPLKDMWLDPVDTYFLSLKSLF